MTDPLTMRSAVRRAYSAAARAPDEAHPFPVGRAFAEAIGYRADELDRLPAASVDAFAGVSCIHRYAEMGQGDAVLDLGCGAGLDTLLASRRVGPGGRVIGVDFSDEMLARARAAAASIGARTVSFLRGDAERIPLGDGSVDVALANGIFNLNPARSAIFGELARVLRPGGVAYAAELILVSPLPEQTRRRESSWFA